MAEKELENVKIEDEVTDVICDKCGRNMVIKYGPHGKFLGCPGFPECHNTKPYLEKIGVTCPKCGKDIVLKKTKKGRRYFGCENNPECVYELAEISFKKMPEMRQATWLKKEIRLHVQMKHVDILKLKQKKRKISDIKLCEKYCIF